MKIKTVITGLAIAVSLSAGAAYAAAVHCKPTNWMNTGPMLHCPGGTHDTGTCTVTCAQGKKAVKVFLTNEQGTPMSNQPACVCQKD